MAVSHEPCQYAEFQQAKKRPLSNRIVHLRITDTILIPLAGLAHADCIFFFPSSLEESFPSLLWVTTVGLFKQGHAV